MTLIHHFNRVQSFIKKSKEHAIYPFGFLMVYEAIIFSGTTATFSFDKRVGFFNTLAGFFENPFPCPAFDGTWRKVKYRFGD